MNLKVRCIPLVGYIFLNVTACQFFEQDGNNKDTEVITTETVSQIVSAQDGGTLTLEDGSQLRIPEGVLSKNTKITLTQKKLENNHNEILEHYYELEPEGLETDEAMTLRLSVTLSMLADGQRFLTHLYSPLSPLVESESEQMNVETVFLGSSSGYQMGDYFDVKFKHFSAFRSVIQGSLYIAFILPAKYLQDTDIVFYLPNAYRCGVYACDGDETDPWYDWFPGHTGLLHRCNESSCQVIEVRPRNGDDATNHRLLEEFQNEELYMGARRPKFALSSNQRAGIIAWAQSKVDEKVGYFPINRWNLNMTKKYSCVGLIESAYTNVVQPIVEKKWLRSELALRPLDMYEYTKPVNEISEKAGTDLNIQINPIFLNPELERYYDYNFLDTEAARFSYFKFTVENLPTGVDFDPNTGLLTWANIPESYIGQSITMTARLRVRYPGEFLSTTISEDLTVKITAADPEDGDPEDGDPEYRCKINSSTFKLPDTGQITSYTTTFGEDSDYSINPKSYTSSTTTTCDDNTKLEWEVYASTSTYTWSEAQTYCNNLTLDDHTNWRVPNTQELWDIVDMIGGSTLITNGSFQNTQEGYYWTVDDYADDSSQGWNIDFTESTHGVGYSTQSNNFYVRCVRGETNTTSFTKNGNNTVTDNLTGLTWQSSEGGSQAWEDAISYCETLDLSSRTDWRLPNIKELKSIVDYGKTFPSLDTNYFSSTTGGSYWSSTTHPNNSSNALYVNFDYGGFSDSVAKTDSLKTRCVRGNL